MIAELRPHKFLYHCSPAGNRESIEKEGIRTSTGYKSIAKSVLFLCTEESVERYADDALRRGGEDVVVFRVARETLDEACFVIDTSHDDVANALLDKTGDLIVQEFGEIAYTVDIPPDAIAFDRTIPYG